MSAERAERDAASDAAVFVQDIADIQRSDLVLSQAAPERHGEDDVVPEAVAVLAGDLQQGRCSPR